LNSFFALNKEATEQLTSLTKLKAILRSIAHRHTSNAADEPVCLATLLELDPTPVLQACDPERMAVVLSLMHRVPASIIFNRGPRMSMAGYGWAPRSFMVKSKGHFSEATFALQYDVYNDPLVPIGDDGTLTVMFPGLLLSNKEVFTHAWLTRTDTSKWCNYRLVTVSKDVHRNDDHYDASTWYYIRVIDDDDEDARLSLCRKEDLAIICSELITQFAAETAGVIVAQSTDVHGVASRFLRRVSITLLPENPVNDFRKRDQHFLRRYRSWGQVVPGEQQWSFTPATEKMVNSSTLGLSWGSVLHKWSHKMLRG